MMPIAVTLCKMKASTVDNSDAFKLQAIQANTVRNETILRMHSWTKTVYDCTFGGFINFLIVEKKSLFCVKIKFVLSNMLLTKFIE